MWEWLVLLVFIAVTRLLHCFVHHRRLLAEMDARRNMEGVAERNRTANPDPETQPSDTPHARRSRKKSPWRRKAVGLAEGCDGQEQIEQWPAPLQEGVVQVEQWPAPLQEGVLADEQWPAPVQHGAVEVEEDVHHVEQRVVQDVHQVEQRVVQDVHQVEQRVLQDELADS